MIGDTPKVAYDHYGKEWSKSYAEPLWVAIGVGAQTKTKTASERSKTSPAIRRKKAR